MPQKQKALMLDSQGKCIVCEVESETRTRGLCTTDYNRFLSALRQLRPEERADFEKNAIEKGKLLPSRQGQRGGADDNVFASLLKEFLQTRRQTPEQINDALHEAQDLEDEKVAEIEKLRKPRKKNSKRGRRKT